MSRHVNTIIPWLLCALLFGCAHTGMELERAELPQHAPKIMDILTDLAFNDLGIGSFRAAGTFTLESPETDAVQRFRRGKILFRRPADLYIQGNHNVTNMAVFKLVCSGKEFVLEFPASAKNNYYSLEGEEFEEVPFPVSPADVTREIFLSEAWGEFGRRGARVVDYDAVTGLAVVEVGKRGEARRLLEVVLMGAPEPRWVVVRNVRLGPDGAELSITRLGDYRVVDGTRFPAWVEAYFPTESTRMTFEFRNVRLNVELADETFDVRARARELGLAPQE